MSGSIAPALPLYAYQRRWVNDDARFKIAMFARQCGKTFTSTLELALDCARAEALGLALPAGWRSRFPCDPEAPMVGTWRGVFDSCRGPAGVAGRASGVQGWVIRCPHAKPSGERRDKSWLMVQPVLSQWLPTATARRQWTGWPLPSASEKKSGGWMTRVY